jgi:hypothetical protein
MAINFKQAVRISALSTTYVQCRVSATEGGVASNPTSGTAHFAFISEASDNESPASSAWVAGSWDTGTDGYWAKCLVGPDGSTELATGSYDVWIKVTKGVETVIDRIGTLSIY